MKRRTEEKIKKEKINDLSKFDQNFNLRSKILDLIL